MQLPWSRRDVDTVLIGVGGSISLDRIGVFACRRTALGTSLQQ